MSVRAFLASFLLAFSVAGFAETPDVASLDTLLRSAVKSGHVDYPAFHARAAFRNYLAALGKPAALPSKAEQLAYNINAYNDWSLNGTPPRR